MTQPPLSFSPEGVYAVPPRFAALSGAEVEGAEESARFSLLKPVGLVGIMMGFLNARFFSETRDPALPPRDELGWLKRETTLVFLRARSDVA